MIELSLKQQKILSIVLQAGKLQSSDVHQQILKNKEKISLVTVKRILSQMVQLGLLQVAGSGRSTTYELSALGRIVFDIDAREYCQIEPDKRYGQSEFNFDLFDKMPIDIFNENELDDLDNATDYYHKKIKNLSPIIQKKELERLIIELSWKSSRIEGNTYTLLDTEKLILENKINPNYKQSETIMILNHKKAFDFIRNNVAEFRELNKKNIEAIHEILVKDLDVDAGLRNQLVGVTGSKYRPLDNVYQIEDAINKLSKIVAKMENSYAKALLALIGIAYIQPFADGNKRTSRLMANALLLAYGNAPLSYRSIEENDYRSAMLVFYEINSIIPIKQLFIEQYIFACQNYAVK